MQRLKERMDEGFMGDGYERYKRKVLDALSSVGIVMDEKKLGRAEKWIRDFYADRMNAYDCAGALMDNSSMRESENAPDSGTELNEALERYASEIIGSAEDSRDAVYKIRKMDALDKSRFDHVVGTIASRLGVAARILLSDYGYEILKLVTDMKLNDHQIIKKFTDSGESMARMHNAMSVAEALEIIEASGKRVDEYIDAPGTPSNFGKSEHRVRFLYYGDDPLGEEKEAVFWLNNPEDEDELREAISEYLKEGSPDIDILEVS